MQLVVTHLTRAPQASISVGGADLHRNRFFRLRPDQGRLAQAMLARHGGPLALGNLLELSPSAGPPRVDGKGCFFDLTTVQVRDRLPPQDFWSLLKELARTTFREIFGPALRKVGRASCGADPAQAAAWLGCFDCRLPNPLPAVASAGYAGSEPDWRSRSARLWREVRLGRLQARMLLSDGQFEADVPVKDVRLHRDDCLTPWESRVDAIRQRIDNGEEFLLSIALSVRHETTTEPSGVHWLEVDNIHFRQDPYWEF